MQLVTGLHASTVIFLTSIYASAFTFRQLKKMCISKMSKPNTASTAKICKQSFEKGPNLVSNSKICELDHLLPLSLVMVYLVLVGFVQFLHLK